MSNNDEFYKVGVQYMVRTVTMIYVGTFKKKLKKKLILENCAWIPDTSRWNEFVRGKAPNEMEPYAKDVLVYEGGILDVTEISTPMAIETI